ncbi:TetR/AcrR family transcriptional regulator [Brucella haematophila]|nr:TetR/AcrR family transcriptional regulator [Brucella haematophila]
MSLDKRKRIIAAASRLIVRDGLQCSMAAIAIEARVATGSLYNYFASKDELVREIYADIAQVMYEKLAPETAADLPHEKRVRQYLERYVDFIWEDAERAALFDYLNNNPVLTLKQTADLFREFLAYTDALILAAQEAGAVRSGSPKLLASFARGAIRHTLKRRRPNPAPLELSERQLIIDMCWSALAGRK